MNLAAIRHEATQEYCFCLEPGKFLFRLQTGKDDLCSVTLHTRDKYLPLSVRDTRRTISMKRVACDGLRDYYEAEVEFQVVCLRYCFALEDNSGQQLIYSSCGFTSEIPADIERLFDCPQTLREEERFCVPGWAANKVVYQIFPARFASHLPVEDDVWYQAPIDREANLGGSLMGILSRLDYLRDLGVDVLYLTPVFRSNSTHKYDTIDYYTIDPSFGTTEDLKELTRQAHERGLRVILDGVFNHTAPEFFAFQDIIKNREDSAYKDWYYIRQFPICQEPFRQNYKCFGYYHGMPKLNLRCPGAAAYFTQVALYWLREAGVDGWRLDVGDEISHEFWRSFRKAIKAEFPQALIVGEIWHDAPDFLQGDQWDSVMNYPFYRGVLDLAAAGTITASAFLDILGFQRGNTHTAAYPLLWNLAGSHDTARLRHLCGEDRQRQKLAAALQLLLPGMPMIYYGDEVGLTGANDPDCRRGMLWDENRQDTDMLSWYRRLLHLRREEPAILGGQLVCQEARDTDGLIFIARKHGEKYVLLLFHAMENTVSLPALAGKWDMLNEQSFDGTVRGISAMVLTLDGAENI